jgi:hypothetical protein
MSPKQDANEKRERTSDAQSYHAEPTSVSLSAILVRGWLILEAQHCTEQRDKRADNGTDDRRGRESSEHTKEQA